MVTSVSLSIPTGRPDARDSWTGATVFGLPQEGAGFVTERDAILEDFRQHGVKNLVFVAADVHHAEVIRHRPTPSWSFHELVAGPLKSKRTTILVGDLNSGPDLPQAPDRLARDFDVFDRALHAFDALAGVKIAGRNVVECDETDLVIVVGVQRSQFVGMVHSER